MALEPCTSVRASAGCDCSCMVFDVAPSPTCPSFRKSLDIFEHCLSLRPC